MKFIEALKLKSKLFLLFILITLGLFLLGLVGAVNTTSLKDRIDKLYFGSLIPTSELNEILYIYNANIASNTYKMKYNLTTSQEYIDTVSFSLDKIKKIWKSYKNHYKTYEELGYVNYVTNEIENINEYFQNIIKVLSKSNTIQRLSIDILEANLEHINQVIKKLLDYEMNVARYDRKDFLKDYDKFVMLTTFILIFIIFGVLIVTYFVFKSIQKEHTKLEVVTKKLKKLNKKLENASYTDSLTGLHNRRYFNYVYEKETKRAKRDKKYITFMMVDIDFFKQYNDTYGHIMGDFALQKVANVLKKCFKRPGDFVFRLGGEEFGVLILDTDELNSARLAKDLCKMVKEEKIEHKASKVADIVTVSVGVMSCIADETLDSEELIKTADEMLYKAKETGRDRYMITSEVIH